MREKTDWNKRYQENDLPRDTGMPDISLTNLISLRPRCINRVLEIGCGTAANAAWSAAEICAAVEPTFEILSLQSVLKPSPKQPKPLRFRHCLLRTR